MSEALAAVYPATTLHTCIVHLLRHSLEFAFAVGPWGTQLPTVVASWRRAWTQVIPFFAFPPEVRRVIYTTNTLENVDRQLRKILKTRGHFPNEEAATKLIWLALRNVMARWSRPAPTWKSAMNQFAILYHERFTQQPA